MSRQNHLLHFHISKKQRLSWLDKMAVIAAFVYPLSGLPQVIGVLSGNTEGVSISSWLGFVVFSLFFMMYAIAHKIKPMIITNALWLVIDCLVIFGVFAHKVLA